MFGPLSGGDVIIHVNSKQMLAVLVVFILGHGPVNISSLSATTTLLSQARNSQRCGSGLWVLYEALNIHVSRSISEVAPAPLAFRSLDWPSRLSCNLGIAYAYGCAWFL